MKKKDDLHQRKIIFIYVQLKKKTMIIQLKKKGRKGEKFLRVGGWRYLHCGGDWDGDDGGGGEGLVVDVGWRVVGRWIEEGRFLPGLKNEKIFELKFRKDLLTWVDLEEEEEDVVELIGRSGIYKKNTKFHRNYFQISLTIWGCWVTVGGLLLVFVVVVVAVLLVLLSDDPNKQHRRRHGQGI
jgi:hypothetical protein